MSSGLILPPGVTRKLYEERLAREQRAAGSGVFVRDERCREFDVLLRQVEPYLFMVFCSEPAPHAAVACGARPGRYNIVREVPGQPLTFIPVTASDGGFTEPTSHVFEMLARMDWWDGRVNRDRRDYQARLERAREKREQVEHEDRVEDMLARWKAVSRTQVSMNPDTPWAQNHAGYKRVRGQKAQAR